MSEYHISKPSSDSTHFFGKPRFTDTVNPIGIQFAEAIEKEPRHYEKAKNPLTLFKSNFHGSRTYHISKPDFFSLVRAKDPTMLEMLCQEARNRGKTGEVIVKVIMGGLGRKRFSESYEAYLARKPSGWIEVCRIWVD